MRNKLYSLFQMNSLFFYGMKKSTQYNVRPFRRLKCLVKIINLVNPLDNGWDQILPQPTVG